MVVHVEIIPILQDNYSDTFSFGSNETIHIIETPGHTMGHICYYFENANILFSGDTLFSMGCGRLFEGTSDDMFESFEKLKKLPDDCLVYCGHEYTLSNAKFCIENDRDNQKLQKRYEEVFSLRDKGLATIPTTIGLEKETNIFMRCNTPEEFKKYRDLKDSF